MAKSSASNAVISPPKGGGTLQGIAEKLSPDLFIGADDFRVPLTCPPRRNGFQPIRNLFYNTDNGNGPFGLGWKLSLLGTSRKTPKEVYRCRDTEDVFILSSAKDLCPVLNDFSGTVQYCPSTGRLMELFSKESSSYPNRPPTLPVTASLRY